ncbi:MAG: Arc family DNA binding domain-containing protein [Thermoleophilia bacterium]
MAQRKQYLLRVDPGVWAEIEHWAADDLRSVNAQVEWILRDALRRHARDTGTRRRRAGDHGEES